jgi:hypothetical protein
VITVVHAGGPLGIRKCEDKMKTLLLALAISMSLPTMVQAIFYAGETESEAMAVIQNIAKRLAEKGRYGVEETVVYGFCTGDKGKYWGSQGSSASYVYDDLKVSNTDCIGGGPPRIFVIKSNGSYQELGR